MAKTRYFGLLVTSLTAAALTACTQTERSAQTTSETETRTAQTQGDQGASQEQDKEQVISQEVTPSDEQLGGQAVKRGEQDVKAQREVVTKKTETLDESVPTVTTGQAKIDVNRMQAKDFVVLGLDQRLADQVVKHRDQHGAFRSMDDLARIPGMDQNWLNKYRDRFAFVGGDSKSAAGEAGNE